jgi:hypothetical protein
VIREGDIVACGDGQVCFRYRNAKTARIERPTVSGARFLWLVLQHVLPKGFRRARNFGFLHPNCKRIIALLHVLLKFVPAQTTALGQGAGTDSVHLLRGGDGDRENAHSVGVPGADARPPCRREGSLIV